MADHQLRALARRLDVLERDRIKRKQPSLAYSSIDDGALFAVDADGNITMIIGSMYDGSNGAVPVTGPVPPVPTVPFVTPTSGSLRIYWDGTFAGGAVAPMDFSKVLAYAVPLDLYNSPDPLNPTFIVGQWTSPIGGEITATLDPGVEYAVYLVCWSQAGKFSDASLVATGLVGVTVVQAQLDAEAARIDNDITAIKNKDIVGTALDDAINDAVSKAVSAASGASAAQSTADGKNTIFVQGTTPTANKVNDIWVDTANGNLIKRWTGTTWEARQDSGISSAASAASAAQTAANDAKTAAAAAQSKADSASQAAADAAGVASSKAVVLYQTTTPTATYQNSNTLWIDITGSSNTPKRWNGSAWVSVTDKAATDAASAAAAANQAASAAQTAATNAQNTADGKGRAYFQTTAPSTTNSQDLWIDITNGANTPKRWNGTAWVAVTDKVATDAAAAASAAQGTASSALTAAQANSRVYYQTTAPSSTNSQDLWIDITNGANTPKRWNGSAWATVTDKVATDAASTANAKGTVYFQTTAPASTLPQDLWIDITGGANTPKRYTGGAWVAVTDKVATDAASLASTANSTATSAQSTANNALSTANGKNKVVFSTGNATGTSGYTAGDVWYQRDANGNVIGQWEYTGSGWASRYLADAVLSSLTVGKLTSGSLGVIDVSVGTGGVIRSNDYVAGSKGWRLSTGGLEINEGAIKISSVSTLQSALDAKETPSGAQTKADTARSGAVSDLKTLWGLPSNSTLINGGLIATNTILASSIAVADFTNYIPDPYVTLGGWSLAATAISQGPSGAAASALHFTGNGTYQGATHAWMPVTPGDSFAVKAQAKWLGTASGSIYIDLLVRRADGSSYAIGTGSAVVLNTKAANTWFTLAGSIVIPADAVSVIFRPILASGVVAGTDVYFTNLEARRKNGAELIVDGAVQANHFTGNSFNGVVMTSPVFQTNPAGGPDYGGVTYSTQTKRGIKIVGSDNGGYGSLIAYDSAGLPTFTLNGKTGDITMKGTLTSGSAISGATITGSSFKTATGLDDIEIIPGGAFGPSTINFLTNNAQYDSTTPASLSCWDLVTTVGTVTYDTVSVTLQGPKMLGSSNTPKIVLANGRNRSTAAVQGGIDYYAAGVDGTNKATHDFYIDNVVVHYTDSTGITLQSGKSLGIGSAASGAPAGGLLATGNIITTAGIRTDGIGTQGSGSLQAYWNPANGFFQKASGSARKYKENIQAVSDALADLAIQVEPVTFTYIPGHDDEPGVLQTGFIADQAAELGGLDFWVIRDIETGEIENFRYDRWAVAQQAILRKHDAAIKTLEAENQDLRTTIDSILGRLAALEASA